MDGCGVWGANGAMCMSGFNDTAQFLRTRNGTVVGEGHCCVPSVKDYVISWERGKCEAAISTTLSLPCIVDGHATASCFAAGGVVDATDATATLQAALSSNASYLLLDDIGKPWVVRPLFLSQVTDMVIELQPRVHILAKQNEFHGVSAPSVADASLSTCRWHAVVLRLTNRCVSSIG